MVPPQRENLSASSFVARSDTVMPSASVIVRVTGGGVADIGGADDIRG